MLTTIYQWISMNWLAVTLTLSFLYWIAKKTDWTWDDKVIEYIKELLNILFPGKKLYSLEDIGEKGIQQLKEEEQEYRRKRPMGRIKEETTKALKGKNK